jgi:hypothetical protein
MKTGKLHPKMDYNAPIIALGKLASASNNLHLFTPLPLPSPLKLNPLTTVYSDSNVKCIKIETKNN